MTSWFYFVLDVLRFEYMLAHNMLWLCVNGYSIFFLKISLHMYRMLNMCSMISGLSVSVAHVLSEDAG